jgi:hypothetical protein
MSLQEGKKWVKRSGERETIYNVHKFMKLSEGTTIPLSSVQKRVIEATRVSRRTVCRRVKEGENVKHGIGMPFSTPRKLRPKRCTKSVLEGFDEAVLRRIVHSTSLRKKDQH